MLIHEDDCACYMCKTGWVHEELCGPSTKPESVEMTPEEVERLNNTEQGQMFHFRGKDYLYCGRHARRAQWVLMTENETFIVTEGKHDPKDRQQDEA